MVRASWKMRNGNALIIILSVLFGTLIETVAFYCFGTPSPCKTYSLSAIYCETAGGTWTGCDWVFDSQSNIDWAEDDDWYIPGDTDYGHADGRCTGSARPCSSYNSDPQGCALVGCSAGSGPASPTRRPPTPRPPTPRPPTPSPPRPRPTPRPPTPAPTHPPGSAIGYIELFQHFGNGSCLDSNHLKHASVTAVFEDGSGAQGKIDSVCGPFVGHKEHVLVGATIEYHTEFRKITCMFDAWTAPTKYEANAIAGSGVFTQSSEFPRGSGPVSATKGDSYKSVRYECYTPDISRPTTQLSNPNESTELFQHKGDGWCVDSKGTPYRSLIAEFDGDINTIDRVCGPFIINMDYDLVGVYISIYSNKIYCLFSANNVPTEDEGNSIVGAGVFTRRSMKYAAAGPVIYTPGNPKYNDCYVPKESTNDLPTQSLSNPTTQMFQYKGDGICKSSKYKEYEYLAAPFQGDINELDSICGIFLGMEEYSLVGAYIYRIIPPEQIRCIFETEKVPTMGEANDILGTDVFVKRSNSCSLVSACGYGPVVGASGSAKDYECYVPKEFEDQEGSQEPDAQESLSGAAYAESSQNTNEDDLGAVEDSSINVADSKQPERSDSSETSTASAYSLQSAAFLALLHLLIIFFIM